MFLTLPALGQATRTWVSGVGDDANPCSRTAPCKTWAGAISKTTTGGEIDALDPGGFGTLTITKAITIDGSAGNVGSVLASGVNGINVSAGSTDTVIIRNVSINGAGTTIGLNGINITNAGTVHIENTKIFQFSNSGISLGGTNVSLTVTDTQIEDITGTGVGVSVSGSGDSALLENTRIFHTGTAISAGDNTTVNAHNVDISQATSGALANSSTGSALVTLDTTTVTGTTTAVQANGTNSAVAMNNCTFSGNGTVFGTGSGTIGSFGNNRVKPGNGTIGVITQTYTPR